VQIINKYVAEEVVDGDNCKIEKKGIDCKACRKFKFLIKNKSLIFKFQALLKGYLIYFSSPQFNICRGIYNRIDHVYPAKEVKYNKGRDHFDCILFYP